MKKNYFTLVLLLLLLATVSFSQKIHMTTWEQVSESGYVQELKIYYDKNSEHPLIAVWKDLSSQKENTLIVKLADDGSFIFYDSNSLEKLLSGKIKSIDGQERLYLNGDRIFMVRTYMRE